ncbi:fungal-specific transcription factor domain-containing protein [Schizophyllum amplum]|uniref:Fungal-specific transcription factor domain-containing protein n=1 Tax=Schizophyllum amplum TaxID=97359 RepID=A0A550CX56_9AGAR|nr:fungal-specific transcription factor domain-containing protein [Auriculariopsis ampla]
MPNNQCTQCVSYGVACTHMEVIKNLGSAKTYVDALEQRIWKLEKIVQNYAPGIDLQKEIENTVLDDEEPATPLKPKRNDDDSPEAKLLSKFYKLKISPDDHRYFGRSSSVMLVKTMLDVKRRCNIPDDRIWDFKRPEFWTTRAWQVRPPDAPFLPLVFPEPDLMAKLVHLFFEKINLFFPLLHRPTFQRYIDQELYLKDRGFAHVLLLLCGCASRYTDDPRVFLQDVNDPHSAGWKWVSQVRVIRSTMIEKPTLFEIQGYFLSVLYNGASSAPQGVWTEVGLGIRMCMEVGAHRRRYDVPTVQSELWKRAFWVLVCLETNLCAFFGFQGSLQSESFDLDLPIACDDEYWDTGDPNTSFKQPPGRPSKIEYFNQYLKLMEIYTATFVSVYYTRKPRLVPVRPTDAQTMAMLNSELNAWLGNVPEHLRWDPERADPIFFDQSASLTACYHHLQIFVHKPFITPLESTITSLTFPSLAICTFAARSCSRVIEIQSKRSEIPLPHMQMSVFTAGLVLLLNIWTGRQSGLAPNAKDLEDVQICMDRLKVFERRFHGAGRKWDILHDLAFAADVEYPGQAAVDLSRKRRRDEDTPISATAQETLPSNDPSAASSTMAPSANTLDYGDAMYQRRGSAKHASGSESSALINDFVNGYINSQSFPTSGPTGVKSIRGASMAPPAAQSSSNAVSALLNAPDMTFSGPLTLNDELEMLLGDAAPNLHPQEDTFSAPSQSSPSDVYNGAFADVAAPGFATVADMYTPSGAVTQGIAPHANYSFDFNMASSGMSMWNVPIGLG